MTLSAAAGELQFSGCGTETSLLSFTSMMEHTKQKTVHKSDLMFFPPNISQLYKNVIVTLNQEKHLKLKQT